MCRTRKSSGYPRDITGYTGAYLSSRRGKHHRSSVQILQKICADSLICMFRTRVSSWVHPALAPPSLCLVKTF